MAPEVAKSEDVNDVQPVTTPSVADGEVIDKAQVDLPAAEDPAAHFLSTVGPFPPMTPVQEKKLVRKIDRWMIPLLLFMCLLGAVDKVQLATGELYGFSDDNGLVGQQYSWLGSILSLGMLVGIWPSSYLIHRLPAAKYLSACSMCWSLMTLCIAACHNWAGLMVLRFLMGMFEAIISPGTTLIISVFWKKSEQPIRNAIILSVFSSVVNGFLSWVVGLIPGDAPLARWQYLYLITGSINGIYSIVLLIFLPDSPMNARFLTVEERWHAVQRLAENRTGIEGSKWKWDQALEAISDVKTWIMFFFNISLNIPNGGLITFGAIIINNLGFDPQTSALLSMPNGVISTLSGCIASYCASKWNGRRTFVVMIAICFPLLGTALAYGLPRSNLGGQLFGLYMMYCYWGPYVSGVSLPQANTAGSTKKVVTYGIMQLGYSAGNLIGPQTFRANQAPAYTGGTVAMLVCYCVAMALMFLYFLVASWENRKKQEKYGPAQTINEESLDELFDVYQDLTDKKQKNFRYVH
ncbi:transporter [Geosmithia morbida]|uniref:Transporter n=1 Tax=Geosmithia morbida TaxID=1094350 RepID=A0A9P4YZW5_9HYPO|nr:transporter [Geosmithia morbida]KAF4125985.1 transporter [Geosmithia morbida]